MLQNLVQSLPRRVNSQEGLKSGMGCSTKHLSVMIRCPNIFDIFDSDLLVKVKTKSDMPSQWVSSFTPPMQMMKVRPSAFTSAASSSSTGDFFFTLDCELLLKGKNKTNKKRRNSCEFSQELATICSSRSRLEWKRDNVLRTLESRFNTPSVFLRDVGWSYHRNR